MSEHELKCWPEYFQQVRAGNKHFELRLDDRGFQVSDTLILREYLTPANEYTGEVERVLVTSVLRAHPGLVPGYVIMSVEPI